MPYAVSQENCWIYNTHLLIGISLYQRCIRLLLWWSRLHIGEKPSSPHGHLYSYNAITFALFMQAEIEYAETTGKVVRYLEPQARKIEYMRTEAKNTQNQTKELR